MHIEPKFYSINKWGNELSSRVRNVLIYAMHETDTPLFSIKDLHCAIAKEEMAFIKNNFYFKNRFFPNIGKKSWNEILELQKKYKESLNKVYSIEIQNAIKILTENKFQVLPPN